MMPRIADCSSLMDSLHSHSLHRADCRGDLPSGSHHHHRRPDNGSAGGVGADADASVSAVAVRARALARAQTSGAAASWAGDCCRPSHREEEQDVAVYEVASLPTDLFLPFFSSPIFLNEFQRSIGDSTIESPS